MASTRRLTAILAADVAGYSRLMEADEEGTHERLKTHFEHLINPEITLHRGRTVKTTGDGLLAEFASVVDAVRCAAEIQRGMIDRDARMPAERRIGFRIGINLGDVIAEGEDIFGDGVNVAARLEALAEPGGICLSGTVYDHIRDRLPYPLADLGEQSVKNISRPVRVYAVHPAVIADLPAASVPSAGSISQHPAAPRLSIVVLPFDNLSNDAEQQYFADGITEDLTTDLSRIEGSFVISRNSAFTYRNKPINAKQIGRELGVRYVLEGSVRRSGNRVRVGAQLIDAESDSHLWAQRFDRDTDDLFALQDEITSRIAITLNLELVRTEAGRTTEHPGALDYIFRGRAAGLKPESRENYAEAISMFERALALDPHSVEAETWMALALAGRVLGQMSGSVAADIGRAERLVDHILASKPGSLLAHLAKGQLLRAENRYEEAMPEYEMVIASNRNWVSAYSNLGRCKMMTGFIDETIPLVERAIQLSPRDPGIGNWYFRIGQAHLLQSRTGEAILWLEKARSVNPALAYIHGWLASAYTLKGERESAAIELAEARKLSGDGRYSSIARVTAALGVQGAPKVSALFEATFFAGLRKAGVPEE
jgi:adenylate cyclase